MFFLSVLGQVEDYAPFIDTLDYVFHTPGITAVEVTQCCPNTSCQVFGWRQRRRIGLTAVPLPCRYARPEAAQDRVI